MPRTSDMIPSKYLKRGDIGPGQLWTISGVDRTEFDGEKDKEKETKWILHFSEANKGLTLNKTNIKMLEKVCGSDDTDHWVGKQVVLYWDDTVDYMGEIVGGIRIRAPKSKEEQALPF